jgi:hypothetical protein
MEKKKFTARVNNNIYFLSRIGSSLRWATQGMAAEELSPNVQHLLARLDRLEAIAQQLSPADNDAGCEAPNRRSNPGGNRPAGGNVETSGGNSN